MRLALLGLLLCLAGCADTVSPPAAPAPPQDNARGFAIKGEWHTAEYWLSIIDDSAEEKDYGYLIDALRAKFPGLTRHQISDYLTRGQQMLRQKGIRESLTEFGWHLDASVPKDAAGAVKMPEVMAAYMVLRVGER